MSTGPAVLNGRIRYVSVSQIERFDASGFGGCQRKWWFRYVGGLKETQGKAAKLGEQVHSQLEYYLKNDGPDVLGELARAGRRFIPKPGPGLRVETAIGALREHEPGGVHGPVDSDLTCAGVAVIGRLDVVDERVEHVVEDAASGDVAMVLEPGVVEVLDWKTTRQIDDVVDADGTVTSRGYAKTVAELANTHQMVGYAELVRRTYPGVKAVRVSHGYFQTQGPRRAVKRSTVLQLDEVVRRYARSEVVVEEMKTIAAVAKIDDVPANYRSCNAYGGCQFRAQCPRDPKAVMAEVFGGLSAANLTKRLRRTDNRPTGGAMNLLERVNAKKAGAPAPSPEVAQATREILAEEAALKSGVTPPDAPAPREIAKLPEPGVGGSEGGCPVGGTQRKMDIDAVASKKFACVCGETVKVSPKKLGDGEYYALVPKHGEVEEPKAVEKIIDGFAGAIVDAVKDAVAPKTYTPIFNGAKTAEAKAATPGLTLYLDSIEDGVVATRLEAYAERLAVTLAEEFKATDIRCAPGDSALAFGKYKGALATLVRAEPPAPGAYLVSSSSEFGMIAFDALAPKARCVRGIK